MNSLAKKFSLKNLMKPGLMLLIPVFFGCDTNEDIGIQYDLGSDANVRFQEFTLPATNIYIDSLRTDGENRVLVGSYSNSLTGSVSAEGYFQYSYESGPMPRQRDEDDQVFTDTLKIDSLVLFLEASSVIPQSGLTLQEFTVHELEDSLETGAIYLSNLQQTAQASLGSFNQVIDIEKDTVYRIKLADSFAQDFFNNISSIAGDPDRNIITAEFKSMGIISGPSSESISTIDLVSDTTTLVMYTSPVSTASKDTTYLTEFSFNGGKHYTYLDRDRTGSQYDGIFSGGEDFQNFDLPSGNTLIDPLSGISTALSITQLEDFFAENRNILINNASISFEFEAENDRDTLIRFMNFFRKTDGRIFGPATASNPFGNIAMSDQGYLSGQSDPATSILSEEKNKLIITSTLFYQQFYQDFLERDSLVFENPSGGALISIDELVTISTADVTTQRSVFKNNGIKLSLYYTEVER